MVIRSPVKTRPTTRSMANLLATEEQGDAASDATHTWSHPSGASALSHSSIGAGSTSNQEDRESSVNQAEEEKGSNTERHREENFRVPNTRDQSVGTPRVGSDKAILATRSVGERSSTRDQIRRELQATLELQHVRLRKLAEVEAIAQTELELRRLESAESTADESEPDTVRPGEHPTFQHIRVEQHVEQWVHTHKAPVPRLVETPRDTEVPRGERGASSYHKDTNLGRADDYHPSKFYNRAGYNDDLPYLHQDRSPFTRPYNKQNDRPQFTRPTQPQHDNYRDTRQSEQRQTPTHNSQMSDVDRLEFIALRLAKAFEQRETQTQPPTPPKYIQELPYFDGDISEWVGFNSVYDDTCYLFTDVQNVTRLRRALKGQAREAVRALIHTAKDPDEIMQVLKRRFGRPEHIVLAELDRIKRMPKLAEDGRNIGEFASRISNTVSVIKSVGQHRYLNSPDLLKHIEEKLCLMMRFGWYSYLRDNKVEPDLEYMSLYLNDLSDRFSAMSPPDTNTRANRFDAKPSGSNKRYEKPNRRPVNTATRCKPSAYEYDANYSGYDSSEDEYVTRHTVAVTKNTHSSEQARNTTADDSRLPKGSFCEPNDSEQIDSDSDSEYERFQVYAANIARNSSSCCLCNKNHALKDCETFKGKNITERWQIARESHTCFRCLNGTHMRKECKGKNCNKNGCRKQHHKLLHYENTQAPHANPQAENPCPNLDAETKKPPPEKKNTQIKTGRVASVNALSERHAYLKIVPVELYGPKGKTQTYALLDEGSTMTLIEEETALAVSHRGKPSELHIEGVAGKRVDESNSFKLKLKIKGLFMRDLESIHCQTISKLNLPPQTVSNELVTSCTHLTELQDELSYVNGKPTLLIGQDNWHLIVSREVKTGNISQPVASFTKLGWVLHGYTTAPTKPVAFVNYVVPASNSNSIDDLIKDHFSLDSLGIQPKRPQSDPEIQALRILDNTARRLPNGQFEVGLLWKPDRESMPESRRQAERRFLSIEKKLEKNETDKAEYHKQINNLFKQGYAEPAPSKSVSPKLWYLPHFTVTHPQKKKARLVFDAAARSNGTSLNDALLSGPDLLQSLFGVLVRFREGPVAVIGDIKEMFLRVLINSSDRDSLRFLWRESPQKPIEEYRMTSLIFGATSSPCSAIYVKNKNAQEYSKLYPEAAHAIERQFYVDDFLMAFPDIQSAQKMVSEVDLIHQSAKMELRNWASNESRALEPVSHAISTNEKALLGNKDQWERTLGLIWRVNSDTLTFALNLRNTPLDAIEGRRAPTKREISSAVMSVFDPLGLASPVTIQGKAIIQAIWRTGIDWDDPVSHEIDQQWRKWLTHVKALQTLEIPRHVPRSIDQGELHVFVDASERAYAAAVYLRSTLPDGSIDVNLLAAKAKVTPLKPVSIPRLELQAAVLGCRLAKTVSQETTYKIGTQTYWSDSKTVLAWIKSDPRTFKPFVAHRLAELEESTKPTQWRWIPTKLNVADDATRNVPTAFIASHRWFKGPDFLFSDPSLWPKEDLSDKTPPLTGEEKVVCSNLNCNALCNAQCNLTRDHLRTPQSTPDAKRFSKWTRLLRATARVLQAVQKFKQLLKKSQTVLTIKKKLVKRRKCAFDGRPNKLIQMAHAELEQELIEKAETLLLCKIQSDCFEPEIKQILKKEPLQRNSKLRKLSLKIENDLIKIDSRIEAADGVTTTYKSPVVLDSSHPITRLIIQHYHETFNHANHQTVMNELRQKFYIISLRRTVKKITHECQWCRTYKKDAQQTPIGDLPKERLMHHNPPFTCTGVDYFGPMTVTIGRRHEKRWGCLFTCLTTRAVHIELASSLSSSSMIMALRRLIARRGKPATLYSDNGTNFVGADKELTISITNDMKDYAEVKNIRWKFIPPGAPHMGGSWERLVKSIKTALATTLHQRSPKEEVLHTLLLEAEQIVNSRPLTDVLTENSEESLTPNHFLIGRSSGNTSFGSFTEHDIANESTWRASQRLADHFWSRWLKEYLPTLLPRKSHNQNFENPKVGDIVLIVDHTLPRNTWPRGEIVSIMPGRDGKVRVAEVKTNAGILRRPTTRLVILTPNKLPYT